MSSYKTFKIYNRHDFDIVTNGIQLAECMGCDDKSNNILEVLDLKVEDLTVSGKLFCSFCNTNFDDKLQQRHHYKLDWHRYNLKQKLAGLLPVTEDNFIQRADDVSSISGSESETEDESESNSKSDLQSNTGIELKEKPSTLFASRHSKVFFENNNQEIFSIYKCLLHSKKDVPENDNSLVDLMKNFPSKDQTWTIVMLGGGHFAAAVFKGTETIAHKTFHSYTVRAKQGGSQSAKDGKGGGGSHPKSAGASLRRYNEQALAQHVQEILEAWTSHIKSSRLIFTRAVGPHNRYVLFGGKNPPLDKTDPRLRTVPFATRRATFNEVKRVYEILSSIEVYGSSEQFKTVFPISPNKREKEIKTDVEVKPRKNRTSPRGGAIDRAKSREITQRPLPGSDPISSESESDFSKRTKPRKLETCDVEISFKDTLQEFDDSVPRSVKRMVRQQRDKKPKKKKAKAPNNENLVIFKKAVWTGCSINDLELLENVLKAEWEMISKLPSAEENTQENGNQEGGISEKEFLNVLNEAIDEKGNTILHRAAIEGRDNVISLLMKYGSDPCHKNKKNQTPYAAASSKEVRKTFRKFVADYPDKYNYQKSQIPGPIDEETEQQQNEKKRLLKKMKREREKVKKVVKKAEMAENEEMNRFAQLSDREKRALAAERRILSTQTGTVTRRCFLCGLDIAGKVPFEYNDNCFCTITCLKAHRMQNGSKLS